MSVEDPQIASLEPASELSRRGFVVTSLATGFALAAEPISAQTITTDASGLKIEEIKVQTSDGEIPAYAARPASGAGFATILVVHEIFGVHEHIKDVCRRLAKLGYLAVAPALYAREGDVSGMSDVREIIATVVSKVPAPQVASDLDATVAWVRDSGLGDTSRVGITGFCWGGRQVWLYAEHNPTLKAAVAWYGPLQRPTTPNTPSNPIGRIADLKVPVLGLYGSADPGIPVSQVEALRQALEAAGKPCEIVVYPDTPHAFFADYLRATAPSRRRTAGRGCGPGSASTAWLEWHARHRLSVALHGLKERP
jgi:carboxymethylenebutenolidase